MVERAGRVCGVGALLLAIFGAGVASAAPAPSPVTVTAPSFQSVQVGTTSTVPGGLLTGFGVQPIRVVASVTSGELSVPQSATTNVSAPPPSTYDPVAGVFKGPSLVLEGTQDALNLALAQLSWTPNVQGDAEITIGATPLGVAFNPANSHYYRAVSDSGITWDAARAAAALPKFNGYSGYLATITTQAEQDLLTQLTDPGVDWWMGGSSVSGPWQWVTGPEDGRPIWDPTCPVNPPGPCDPGFAMWDPADPNPASGANVVSFGGPVAPGLWTAKAPGDGTVDGYLVEYGGQANETATNLEAGHATVTVTAWSNTDTNLDVSESSPAFGQPIDLTATVEALFDATDTPTGTVSFWDGPTVLGTVELSTSSATFTATTLAPGVHQLWAYYHGESRFSPSGSQTRGVEVAADPTTTPEPTETTPTETSGSPASDTTPTANDTTTGDTVAAADQGGPGVYIVFNVGVGVATGNARLTVRGAGLQPGSAVTVTVNSTPVLMASVLAESTGTVRWDGSLPSDLADGEHTVEVLGTAADGTAVGRVTSFSVDGGILTRIGASVANPTTPTSVPVASSGAADGAPVAETPNKGGGKRLLLLGLLLVAAGTGAFFWLRSKQRGRSAAITPEAKPSGASPAGGALPPGSQSAPGRLPRFGRRAATATAVESGVRQR